MNDNCGKAMHVGIMDRGFTSLETQAYIRNLT